MKKTQNTMLKSAPFSLLNSIRTARLNTLEKTNFTAAAATTLHQEQQMQTTCGNKEVGMKRYLKERQHTLLHLAMTFLRQKHHFNQKTKYNKLRYYV